MKKFDVLLRIKSDSLVLFGGDRWRVALCPDMGGRIFAEVGGELLHRIDLENVENPTREFNNYGGANLWPAPEGGTFGFNYRGDEWYVQPAINVQPFEVVERSKSSAIIRKRAALLNRMGTLVDAEITRQFDLCDAFLGQLAYTTTDTITVMNGVPIEKALIAAWTLEQFDATPNTNTFCQVANPENAINFDFYEHPGDRISYFDRGFTYRTDGQCRGQIGIRKDSGPASIGFFDTDTGIICVRENLSESDGLFFNIADNDQPNGPFSEADSYSIFNSDPDMAAFELETIGSARVHNGLLRASRLTSMTSFTIVPHHEDICRMLRETLGEKK
jgi:hypothetical protein